MGEVDKLMAEFLPWPEGSQYAYWRDRQRPSSENAQICADSDSDINAFVYGEGLSFEEELYPAAVLLPVPEAQEILRRLRLIADRMDQLLAARARDEKGAVP